MKLFLRLAALFGVVLLLTVSLPLRSALALPISVNGSADEWGPVMTAAGAPTFDDGNLNGYHTANGGTLYLKMDSPGTTLVVIYIQGPSGLFSFAIAGGGGLTVRQCLNGDIDDCPNIPSGSPTADRATVIELGIPYSLLGATDNNPVNIVAIDQGTDRRSLGTPLSLPGPLPVTLTSFTATRSEAGVELEWETVSERQILGFNLLGSATASLSDALVLNDGLIFGEGDAASGASYSFTDPAPVAGTSYWLQVVNADGTTEEFGPVQPVAVTASAGRVFLPLVRR